MKELIQKDIAKILEKTWLPHCTNKTEKRVDELLKSNPDLCDDCQQEGWSIEFEDRLLCAACYASLMEYKQELSE